MRITARPLHNHPVQIAPAPARRPWPDGADALFDDPSLAAATSRGWDLACPYAFEATWTGGPGPDDVHISVPGFVNSTVGHGVLTFETGYQFDLEPGHDLWVRGPINQLKHGIQSLDQVIEADLLPLVVTVNWRFTQPDQTVSFARGEPFATILPYPSGYIEQFEGNVAPEAAIDLPGISCICPTYGRPELLEEAVESFLRQEYAGPKELIVLNDLAEQELLYDHPDVHVVNVPRRFRTLGEKLNAAVGLCAYDLVCVWTDDDIYLPHRLALSVERLDPDKGFYKAGSAFMLSDGILSGPLVSVLHGGSVWTRGLFVKVRGYPHRTDGVDQQLEAAFARARFEAAQPARLPVSEMYHIYRWGGTGSYHLSILGNGDGDPTAAYRAAAAHVADEITAGRQRTGRIELEPRWHQEYGDLVAAFVEAVPEEQADAPTVPAIPATPQTLADLPPIHFSTLPRPVPEAEALAQFRRPDGVRISVILPACNEWPFLERTVEQFAATLPPRSEIIVVDNGSTDGCADFLSAPDRQPADGRTWTIAGRDDPAGVVVRLARHPQPLGVAGARNRGFQDAQGEFVVFADAHVDVPPGWWPPVVATLNRPRVGVVGPAFGVIGAASHDKGYGQRIADAQLRVEWLGYRQDDPYPVPSLGGGFMGLRADVLAATGGFDDGMQQWGSEDTELCLRLWLLGYEVWVIPELEIPHNFRAASPYRVEWKHAVHNLLRTAFLHLGEERLARVIHAVMESPEYPRAMAMLALGDTMQRRAALVSQRVHDDDWFFRHPYFADIEMDLRGVVTAAAEAGK